MRNRAIVCILSAMTFLIPLWAQKNPLLPQELIARQKQIFRAKHSAAGKYLQPQHGFHKPVDGKGIISGRILVPDTATSIYDLEITVLDELGYCVYSALSIKPYSYSTAGLYPGKYLVYAEADNPYTKTYFGDVTTFKNAQWITVSANDLLTDKNITLQKSTVLQKDTILISGTCYAGTGPDSVLKQVYIRFRFAPADSVNYLFSILNSFYTYTGTDGAYKIVATIKPRRYHVVIDAPDKGLCPQWWNGVAINTAAGPVLLNEKQYTKDIHFLPGSMFGGKVVMIDSNIVPGSVTVSAVNKLGYSIQSDYIQSNMEPFRIAGLPADTYYLIATGQYIKSTFYPDAETKEQAKLLIVKPGDVFDTMTISARKKITQNTDTTSYGYVKGIVRYAQSQKPASNAGITTVFLDKNITQTGEQAVHSDANGFFTIKTPARKSSLVAAAPPPEEYYHTSTWHNGSVSSFPSWKDSFSVAVNETASVDVSLQPGGSIGGYCVDKNGKPIFDPDAIQQNSEWFNYPIFMLYAWNADWSVFTYNLVFEPLTSGFRLVNCPAGKYSLLVFPELYFPLNKQSWFCSEIVPDISLTANQTTALGNIKITESSAGISGTITNPQEYAVVYCYNEQQIFTAYGYTIGTGFIPDSNALSSFFSKEILVSANSNYSLKYLKPGKYALALIRMNLKGNDPFYIRQWYKKSIETISLTSEYDYKVFISPDIPKDAVWITVGAGQTVTGIDFEDINGINQHPFAVGMKYGLTMLKRMPNGSLVFSYRFPQYTASGKSFAGTLAVYALNGRRVSQLSLCKPFGTVCWNANNDAGGRVAAGIYLFKLHNDTYAYTTRSMYMR